MRRAGHDDESAVGGNLVLVRKVDRKVPVPVADEFANVENLRGNFGKLIKAMPEGSVSLVNIATGMVRPLVEARDKVERRAVEEKNVDESEFTDWGKPIKQMDISDYPEFAPEQGGSDGKGHD